MKTKKLLAAILKDFFKWIGIIFIGLSLFLAIDGANALQLSTIWQICLVAAAVSMMKNGILNPVDYSKKGHTLLFFILTTLADITILVWLFAFTPGRYDDPGLVTTLIIIILLVKVTVYSMMAADGRKQADEMNKKLDVYKDVFGWSDDK